MYHAVLVDVCVSSVDVYPDKFAIIPPRLLEVIGSVLECGPPHVLEHVAGGEIWCPAELDDVVPRLLAGPVVGLALGAVRGCKFDFLGHDRPSNCRMTSSMRSRSMQSSAVNCPPPSSSVISTPSRSTSRISLVDSSDTGRAGPPSMLTRWSIMKSASPCC